MLGPSLRALSVAVVLAAGLVLPAHAQEPPSPSGLTIKPLLRSTLSGVDDKDALVFSIEFAPGAVAKRHTHAGDEYATVLEGELELLRDGETPRIVKAGEAYHSPRGIAHETRNVGKGKARAVATFIVDKGQPLLTPVAAR